MKRELKSLDDLCEFFGITDERVKMIRDKLEKQGEQNKLNQEKKDAGVRLPGTK